MQKALHKKCGLSLRSRRKHKACGVSPRDQNSRDGEPMKWATAIARKSLGIAANVLSPAFAGSQNLLCLDPGAYAPGFMLPPASQAKTELFVQSSAWIQSVPPAVAGGLGQSQ